MEPLTPQETKTVLASINKDSPNGFRNYAILVTLLDSGLRASEIANATLGQLSLEGWDHIKVMSKGVKERIVPIRSLICELSSLAMGSLS